MPNKQPNILVIQADQLSPRALPAYGNTVAKTPTLDSLAGRSTVFENAYCNYPLCGPSRASMMYGLRAFNAGVYDNGTEFMASIPTFAHYLRLLGYQTCLSGKMHFIGPDQLHGFDERLTTDIYPSDFNWAANWRADHGGNDPERLLAAAGEVNGVKMSGIYERTIQLDFDDEVCFKSVRKIHDYARSDEDRPFCLFTSFTHPHDPFAMPKAYWDRYQDGDIDMPRIPGMEREALDAHSQRLYDHIGVEEANMSDEDVRLARHGYYAAISYIDDQVAQLIGALETAGLSDNTIIIFISDHGEALGERGLWFKRSFYDVALRVPFFISVPWSDTGKRCTDNVSLVDLLPTLVDLGSGGRALDVIKTPYDGRSLSNAVEGNSLDGKNLVCAEMAADALSAPAVAIVEGPYKYIHCDTDPPLLFNLEDDPLEMKNLAGSAEFEEIEARLCSKVRQTWDFESLKTEIILSQDRRRIIEAAHEQGIQPNWDYDVITAGRDQYFRPSSENPSASNYNREFNLRLRPDSERANKRVYPYDAQAQNSTRK
jgi:choline-sulfatase